MPAKSRKPRPPLTRRRTILFALLAPWLLLGTAEAVLRGAGALMLARYRTTVEQRGHEGGGEIWAFGDSYTFGVGADNPATDSYPAVVARQLEARTGKATKLVNLAEPGLNSTGIVNRLEARVRGGGRPDLILLLAGVNNTRWLGQSGQFCLEEAAGVAEVGAALTGALGGWRTYKVLRHLVLARRPPRATDRSCAEVAAGFQHLDEGLPDRAQAAFERAVAANPRSGWGELGVGLSLLRVGRSADALSHLDAAAALGVTPPALPLARGFAARAAGKVGEARQAIQTRHDGDLEHFAELLMAHLARDAGDLDGALARFDVLGDLELREDEVPHGGVAPYGLDGRGWTLLSAGKDAEAALAFATANELGDRLHITPHLLGWSHLGLGVILARQGRVEEALTELAIADRDSAAVATARAVAGFVLLQADRIEEAAAALRAARAVVPQGQLTEELSNAIAAGGWEGPIPMPTPAPSIAVQQWLDPADTRLVERDLLRSARLAREAGAVLVVLTYPQPRAHEELAQVQRRVAGGVGAVFVDPRATFEQAHEDLGSWEPLLIPDGHPTTRGYALIAGLVVEAVQNRNADAPGTPPSPSGTMGSERPLGDGAGGR